MFLSFPDRENAMSLEYPIPRLPQPLTEDGLRNLMRERAYWDLKHPSSPLYQRLVAQGFSFLYPGNTKYDETGKAIDVSPLPPEAVAHQVAQVNREMDRLERSLGGPSFVAPTTRDGGEGGFDERPTGSREGLVHVQAHTRDSGKTDVTDYWRAAPREGRDMDTRAGIRPRDPGEGGEDDTRGGANDGDEDRPEPMTNRDTDDIEAAQAGIDGRRPKYDDPFSALPELEIRNDDDGRGRFGIRRRDKHGNIYPHPGVDISAPPGAAMASPADGTVEVRDSYKDGSFDNRYKNVWIKAKDGTEIGLFYVTPHDADGNVVVKTGDQVKVGDPIGIVQDRAAASKTGKMKNHVHVEIRDKSKKIIDPTPHIEEWRRRRQEQR
jgi:murein DD-endopeptidase MepM/ murein hydrolase activator NlpD